MDNAPKPQDESTRSEEERKAAAANDPNAPAPANGGAAGAPSTEASQSGSFKAVFGSGQGSNPWSASGGQNPWDDGPGGQQPAQNQPSSGNAGQPGDPQAAAGQEGGPWGNIGLAGPPSQRLGSIKNPESQIDAASKVLDASSANQSEESRKAAQDMLLNDPWLNPAAGWVQMVLPSKEGEAAPAEGAPTGGPQSAQDGDSAADFLSAWGEADAPSLPKGPSALKGLGVSLNPSKSGNVIPEPLPRLAAPQEPEPEAEDDALGLDPHDRLFPVGQGGRNEPSEAYQKLFDTGSHPIIQLEDRMTAPEGMGIQDPALREKPTGPQPPPPPEPTRQPTPAPSAPEVAPQPAPAGPPPLPNSAPAAAAPPMPSAAPEPASPPPLPPAPDAAAPPPVAPAAVPPNAAPHMQPMPPAHTAGAQEPPKPAQPGWMKESGGLTSTQTGLPALHPPQQQLPSWLAGSQQQQSQQQQQQAQQLPQQSAPQPAQPPQAPPAAAPEPVQAAPVAAAPGEAPRPTTPPPLPPQHQQAFPPEGPPTQQGLPAQHQHVPGWMLESPAQRAAKELPPEAPAPAAPIEKPQQQLPSWLQSQSTQTNLPAQPDPFQQPPTAMPQPAPAEPPAAVQQTPPAPAAPPTPTPPPPAPEPVAPVAESTPPPLPPAPPPAAPPPPPMEQPSFAEPFDQTVPPFPNGQPPLQPISETPAAPPPLPAAPPPLPTAAPNYTPQSTQQAPVQQPPQQSMPPMSSQGGFVSYQQSAPPPQAPQSPPPAPPPTSAPPPLPSTPAASPYDPMQAHAELDSYAQAARFQAASGSAAPTPPPAGPAGSDQVSSGQQAVEGTGSHHSLLPPHKPHRQPDDDGELSADELRAMRRKKTTDALRRATTSDEAEPETEEEAETKATIAKIGPAMTMSGIAVATILLLGAFGLLINYMMGHGEANNALKVAQSFLRQGNPKEARRTLEPLVKQGTKDAGVYAALGECALQMKDNADAVKNYTEAVSLDPKDPAYLVGRAGAYLEAGRGDDALRDANAALALNPNYADGLKVRALAFARTFDYPKSLDDSDEYLRRNSNPPADAYATRALALLHMKRYAEAVDDYSRAARMDSTKGEYVAGKAEALKDAGQYREAIAAVEKALNMMGRRIELLRLRGDCYVLNNQLDDAIKDYEAVASISPAKENLVRTADVAMKANQFNMANYYYTKALEIDPKDTRIKTLKELASKNVASKAVVISVPTQPTSSSISPAIIAKSSPSQLNSMGVRYMGSGYYQEAASLFAAALKRQPKNIEARRQLTQCYLQLGQRSEAKAQIRTLVSMKALSAYDAQYFARSLLALNDAADVPGFLWPVLRSHKRDFSLRATLIQALMASRQNSQAMQVAAEGVSLAQREQDKAMMQEYLRTAQQAPYGRR